MPRFGNITIELSDESLRREAETYAKFEAGRVPCKSTASGLHEWARRPALIRGFFIEECRACGADRVG